MLVDVRKVSDSVKKFSDGVKKVLNGVNSLSNGVRRLSDGAIMSRECQVVSGGCRMVSVHLVLVKRVKRICSSIKELFYQVSIETFYQENFLFSLHYSSSHKFLLNPIATILK